jgi:hypothetical protein
MDLVRQLLVTAELPLVAKKWWQKQRKAVVMLSHVSVDSPLSTAGGGKQSSA